MSRSLTIAFLDDLEGWRHVEAIATRAGTPVAVYVGTGSEDGPLLRIDIDANAGDSRFQAVRIVHGVAGGILHSAGEWDPPGGWRDFTLSLGTGDVLSGGV